MVDEIRKLINQEAEHADRCCAVEQILDAYAQPYLDNMPLERYGRLVRALARLMEGQ